jgi:hypothetical protein
VKGLAALTALVLVVTLPSVAHAGVEVDPDEAKPSLHMRVVVVHRGAGSHPARTTVHRRHGNPVLSLDCDPNSPAEAQRCTPVSTAPRTGRPGPELTEGDIAEAVREIGLPSLRVRIQPGDETLVNIETIFYTRPQPFERSIDLLGSDIDLVASPVSYRWVHDDGTASTTSRPGRPYPAMDVTHRYRAPADDVHPRVDVTYRVRYRVDGGGWQTLGQTLQASGPAADLDVREAAPVLTKP